MTVTSWSIPAVSAGAVAAIRVGLATEAETGVPPIDAEAPAVNWLPTSDSGVPPEAGPEVADRYASWKLVAADAVPAAISAQEAAAARSRPDFKVQEVYGSAGALATGLPAGKRDRLA